MSQEPQSEFSRRFKGLRARLADEKDCQYFVYTPVGRINVERWNYPVPGVVSMEGNDDDGQYRFLIFSDEAMCSFALEIKRKTTVPKKMKLGFKPVG